jgi:Arc-like DNA binding dprotein
VWAKAFDMHPKQMYNGHMEKKEPKAKAKPMGTRYPLDVLEAMKQLAKHHNRSFNSEVIWALRQYITRERQGN